MSRMPARRLAFVLALLAAATACGEAGSQRSATDDTTVASSALEPDRVSKLRPSRLRVAVGGTVSFSFDEIVDLRVVTIDDPRVSTLQFLSVGIHDLEPVGPDETFRIAFDLASGYRGPGRYEIPAVTAASAGSAATAPSKPQGLSTVYLTYVKLKPGETTPNEQTTEKAHQFESVTRACTLEVGRDGASGSLSCPEIIDAVGEGVRLEMDWEPAQ